MRKLWRHDDKYQRIRWSTFMNISLNHKLFTQKTLSPSTQSCGQYF